MRLLHTADWHVGKTIRGRGRWAEFEAALDRMVEIAVEERVDAVLVAGDLYDQQAAPAEADALVFDTFLRLHDAGIPSAVIAGNHDSAPRLDALGRLLARIGVHVVARVRRPDDGGVVDLPSRNGTETARVACIPFVPERRFGDAAALFDAPANWYVSYNQGMGSLLGAMAASFDPSAVNLVLAHLFADGARPGGGERELTVGMAYAVAPSHLPAEATYVALGHVHRPQTVPRAAAPARYAGSLLQLDFGETEQDKCVFVIEAGGRTPARVRAVPLDVGRRLLDLHATLDELPALAPLVGDAFVRVFLRTDGPVPGIADRVRALVPDALDVQLVYERHELEVRPSLRSLAPREQFVSYYRGAHGAEPAPALLEAFDRVLDDVGAQP
ncbi:MAG: metallophosphoesterase family protein [Actinomycetota bacterium]